jgi:hypothetical protein
MTEREEGRGLVEKAKIPLMWLVRIRELSLRSYGGWGTLELHDIPTGG